MDTAALDQFRAALLAEADVRFGGKPIENALAKGAIEAYCAAYRTYLKAVGANVTSYSVNGRSVTRATPDPTLWREAYRRLRTYFPDLPAETASAASVADVDFSGMPRP